jgi:hypothetical protein
MSTRYGRVWTLASALALALALAGCGGGSSGCEDGCDSPDGAAGGADARVGPDGGGPSGAWTTLVTGDWELPAGGELTSDLHTITLDRDVYVGAIRPIEPLGTHHTVLALGNFDAGNIIYASGVGTNEIAFPDGVGLALRAGQNLVLQLHVYNTREDALTGTSGIEIVEVDAADVVHQADLFLPGPLGLNIPPMQESTQRSTCTIQSTYTLFALFPHMHQLGTHFKTTVTVGGEDIVIHDGPYQFEDQAFIAFDPITLAAGDKVTTECTWDNPTADAVGWGESSTTEMCFSILYRYPAGGQEFCTN